MDQIYRFSYQENQYNGECLPCTAAVFNQLVDSKEVAWKIGTRQAVEKAIMEDMPLDVFANDSKFVQFCRRQQSESFALLPLAMKLLQWTNSLKMSLPCFIFGVRDFALVPKTDKEGNPVLDKQGKPVMTRRRKLEGIEHLSSLFMFDGDHLSIDPCEVYERTLRPKFPWKVQLAHKTSSGHGLRLVCEARLELGNIADNQICLARELGLMGMLGTTGKPVVDDSCIDATRISYCPRREDIYYIDEEHLFNLNIL